MDIANENSSVSLPLRLGQLEARKIVRSQVHIAAVTHSSELYIARNVGHTEGEGHGQAEGWHESTVRKHYGSFS